MRTHIRWSALAVTLLTVAACSDDPVEATGDELSAQETQSLAYAVMSSSFAFVAALPVDPGTGTTADGVLAEPVEFSFDETVPCPQGGSVSIEGTVSGDSEAETGSWDLDYSGTVTHMACVVQGFQEAFTLDGDPAVAVTVSTTYVDHEPSGDQTWSYDGNVGWQTGDKQGTCSMNLDFAWAGTGVQNATIGGTVCGQSVDYGGV